MWRALCRFRPLALLRVRGLLDDQQEFGVALGALHPVHQDLERLLGLKSVQNAAELVGVLRQRGVL